MNDQTRGVLLTSLGVLAIVPDTLLIRLMDTGVLTVVFWRALFAAATIMLSVVFVYRGKTLQTLRQLGKCGFLYALFMGLGTLLFVSAAQLTTIANTVFIVSISPVFAAIVSRIFLAERISKRMTWTIGLSLIGIAVIAYGSIDGTSSAIWGDLCAFGAAFALAISFTAARAGRSVSMVPAAGLAYVMTTLAVLPFVTPSAGLETDSWIYALLLGCVFVPIGTSLMALGARYIPSAEVSLLLLLEAVLAPLLVWAVLNEFPGTATLIGGAIVLGVLAGSNFIALRKTSRA
ncbi:MAG: EamA family transporter [Hyphomicrobiales bacterium]|nr:MAG: EamA family transporter [Hyphomicrobiales bacterium]